MACVKPKLRQILCGPNRANKKNVVFLKTFVDVVKAQGSWTSTLKGKSSKVLYQVTLSQNDFQAHVASLTSSEPHRSVLYDARQEHLLGHVFDACRYISLCHQNSYAISALFYPIQKHGYGQ